MLTLMVDIGHRTGLFEAAAKGAGTSQDIAARAGLDERYVREQMARQFLTQAGFTSVEAVDAPGPQNTIYVCRR